MVNAFSLSFFLFSLSLFFLRKLAVVLRIDARGQDIDGSELQKLRACRVLSVDLVEANFHPPAVPMTFSLRSPSPVRHTEQYKHRKPGGSEKKTSTICFQLSLFPCTSLLTFLRLHFVIYKMGVLMPTDKGCRVVPMSTASGI